MGVISLDHIDNLFWLGRYSERVYTTIRLYFHSFDNMIDITLEDYKDFCESLDIPDIYGSAEIFNARYPFDETDINSVYSNLTRAYDNGIIMRELLGSETLSYIQLAMYEIQKAKISKAPLIEMQAVIDNILAFWGMVDDSIDNTQVQNIIKCGKCIERIDLYARLKMDGAEIFREVKRLRGIIEGTQAAYHKEYLNDIEAFLGEADIPYRSIIQLIETIMITY